MTLFAFVEVRRGGELARVFVGMAIDAERKLQFVNCRLARREVALLALHFGVLAFQRVFAGGMFLSGKGGRLPPANGMAGCALPPARTLYKLPTMRVGRVTIRALRELQRLLKISALVAGFAGNFKMLAHQRIFRLRMVKLLTHRRCIYFFPTGGAVAGLAGTLKLTFMRIGVAVVTASERQPFIARRSIGTWRVALLALHLRVRPGQRIARLAVIEFSRLLPVDNVVTLQAVLPKLPFMEIRMTRHAIGREPQKRPRNVLHLDLRALAGGDVRWSMTFCTGHARMLTFQLVARLRVVEIVGIETENLEIHSVMFGVATRTILRTGLLHDAGMVSAMSVDAGSNFSMAFHTLQCNRPAKLVAGGALRHAIE